MNKVLSISIFLCLYFSVGFADSESEKPAKTASPIIGVPEEEIVSEGQLALKSGNIPYKAVAGTYHFKDDQGVVKARFFYIAYTRSDSEDKRTRPIAFCFNGGPGAASVWMHMGLLGPKRVVFKKDNSNVPPFQFINNEYSLLDATDLVFIDPISTGYSRAAQGEDSKHFNNVDEDIKSIAEFVRLYTTRNSRWESPKFLFGESYGTMRAVELASYLYNKLDLATNGAALISSVLNFATIDILDQGNDLPFSLFLPAYTAIAGFHHKLSPGQQADVQGTVRNAEAYAMNEYPLLLLRGDTLSPEQRRETALKLSLLTGLSPEFIERVDLRIKPYNFMQELLRSEGKVIGRFDARVTGRQLSNISEYVGYDPSMDNVISAFTSSFNEYVRNDLKWIKDDDYRVLADLHPWGYGKKAVNRYFNAVPTLRELMLRVPAFSVFVASGYYDLATPSFGSLYTFNNLNLGEPAGKRLTMKYYPSGHMMYTDHESLVSLSDDLHTYIEATLKKE
ncbi:MAG: peptidase S10 [Parachlamydiaceae bacterium]|nr:peptidase S10 [Parachlamydiaceae bacterium]